MTSFPQYIVKPEFVVGGEAIIRVSLFNPDTNQIRVSNHTSLFIWNLCYEEPDRQDILEYFKAH